MTLKNQQLEERIKSLEVAEERMLNYVGQLEEIVIPSFESEISSFKRSRNDLSHPVTASNVPSQIKSTVPVTQNKISAVEIEESSEKDVISTVNLEDLASLSIHSQNDKTNKIETNRHNLHKNMFKRIPLSTKKM